MEPDSTASSKRRQRLGILLVTLAWLAIGGISLWLKTGHPVTMPLAVGFCLLLLLAFVVSRLMADARYKEDPAVFQRVEGGNTWYWRYGRWRGTLAAAGMTSVLLTLGFLKAMQALPGAPRVLHQLFGNFSGTTLLVATLAVSFALVWLVIELYGHFLRQK